MKQVKPKEAYRKVKLSRLADLKIRVRLFKAFLKKTSFDFATAPKLVAGALVVALLVVYIAPAQLDQYRMQSFVSRVEAAQREIEERKETSIYHHKYIVREGKGKAAFVAESTGIPLADTVQVDLRHDVVEEWRHGVTNLSYIETDVAGKPIKVVLNLENEDHMHIFEYDPQNCDELKADGITCDSCENREKATQTYKAHRTTFDSVHDIESLYKEEVSYSEELQKPVNIRELRFMGEASEEEHEYMVFYSENNNLETRFYFDKDTYLLKKKVVSIIDGSNRYEMSEIEELEFSFVPADEWEDVFNPKKYSFEQVDVFPI